MGRRNAKSKDTTLGPPETIRRRMRASAAILMMQEAAAQVRNDATRLMREAHEGRLRQPSEKHLREVAKGSPSAIALGRAKQAQYVINDAQAMMRSYRSNFFEWVKDPSCRLGKPRPPGYYRQGRRVRLAFDYQEFAVRKNRLILPASCGLAPLPLLDREGHPLLRPGDRIV